MPLSYKARENTMPLPAKQVMTENAWRETGEKIYGKDMMRWKFKCPVCGFVQSAEDYKKAGAPESAIAFSCVGRWISGSRQAFDNTGGAGPCTYAGGGLLRLNPIKVNGHECFDFADAEKPMANPE